MITGIDNIRQLFSVFHDGGIEAPHYLDGTLTFKVEISYLAQRINPKFRTFSVTLRGVETLSFSAWLDDPASGSVDPLTALSQEPDILSASIESSVVEVVLNQSGVGAGYSGGSLFLTCQSASVLDESGRECTLDELWALSEAYWTEWSARAKGAEQKS